MRISRRWFMAGLALTGAAVPAAYFGHREWTKPDPTITPGEASFDVADVAGQRLANALRGVWKIRFTGRDAGLDGLPAEGLEVFLDIGQKGRGVCGFLDTPQRLRSSDAPRYRVLGDLAGGDGAAVGAVALMAGCVLRRQVCVGAKAEGMSHAGHHSLPLK